MAPVSSEAGAIFMSLLMRPLLSASLLFLSSLSACTAHAQNQLIFSDALQNNWGNWGWAKTIDLKNASPVHGGASSIAVGAGGWEAIQIHHAPFDSSPFGALSFWVSGGAGGGQKLRVGVSVSDKLVDGGFPLEPLKPNEWKHVVVPLGVLGIAGKPDVTGIVVQNNTPDAAPPFYLDDIELLSPDEAKVALASLAMPAKAPVVAAAPLSRTAPVNIQIDALANRHPISPLIYGDNFADKNDAVLRPTLNRWGGNSSTRYNWKQNADNKGADYFFESVPQDDPTPGGAVDAFIVTSKAIGAAPMITIPMTGWVADVGAKREKKGAFSVAKYGPQTKTDPWVPDAGSGTRLDGKPITNNDPTDANQAVSPDFDAQWVKHLVEKWGSAKQGGVRYYLLDNEPGLWHVNHRDVVPVAPTATELRDRIIAYSKAIRAADSGALIVAPEEWGWNGFLYSPADVQNAQSNGDWNPATFKDRQMMGGQDFMPWLLAQLYAQQKRSGQKVLDYFTLHIYPQNPAIAFDKNDYSDNAQAIRARSTRVLWDENYTDESWIKANVALIPRMKKWAANYPGVKTGITEYCWGADENIGGALAQAEINGIMGREGLDLATRWCAPTPNTVTFKASQLFRNYDEHNSTFGDLSISAKAPNPDALSSFAALRTKDGALTALVVDKQIHELTPLRLRVANFKAGRMAQHFQLTAGNKITRLPDVPVVNGLISTDLPPQSINLFIVPKA